MENNGAEFSGRVWLDSTIHNVPALVSPTEHSDSFVARFELDVAKIVADACVNHGDATSWRMEGATLVVHDGAYDETHRIEPDSDGMYPLNWFDFYWGLHGSNDPGEPVKGEHSGVWYDV